MNPEEKASFIWGGTRARPRKGIERALKTGATFLKPPGSCGTKYPGTSVGVEIECCEDCKIYVLDPCEQVQISECINCRIVVGPCVGSVMLFDCTGCTIAVAAKQTRLRDCANCELRTFAPTSECVVIETSKGLKFGCWDVAYPGLGAQFAASGWPPEAPPAPGAPFANYWDKIFDFSPASGNWSRLPGCDASGRWCELAVSVAEDGSFNSGTVVEKRSDSPAVEGCECPCAAQDGKQYEAAWFDPAAAALLGAAKRAAAEASAKAAKGSLKLEQGVTVSTAPPAAASSKPGVFSRVGSWLAGALGLKKKPAAAGVEYVSNAGGGGKGQGKPADSTTCEVM